MQATETHPPARTLVMVRTGASVVEMKALAVAREPSRSNHSDGPTSRQQSKYLGTSPISDRGTNLGTWTKGSRKRVPQRSFRVVGVFQGAIREVDVPNLIAGKIKHMKFDASREMKEQVASFLVQVSIGHSFVLQFFLQSLDCVNWRG